MTIAPVQAAIKGSSGAASSINISSADGWVAPTPGNLLVITANSDALVTITGAGTLQNGPSIIDGNAAYQWYKTADGTETTITGTPSVSDDIVITAQEFSGTNAAQFDNSNSVTTSSPGLSTAGLSVSASAAGDLIFMMAALHNMSAGDAVSPSWTNGFTNVLNASSGNASPSGQKVDTLIGTLVAGAAGSYSTTASWTNAATDRHQLGMSFKALATTTPSAEPSPTVWWPGNGPWGPEEWFYDPGSTSVLATTTTITSDLDLRWRVANLVTSDADLRWRVTNTITSDVDLRWRVYNSLSSDVDLRWRTSQQVTSDVDLRWRTAQLVNSDLDLRWRTAQLVNSNLDLRWAVRSVVTSDLDARWRVSQQVTSDADLRWRVAVRVTSDADLRWAVRNIVTSDLDARWAVRAVVASDLDARWRVATQVFNGLDVQWRVANLVSSDLDTRWRVFAAITADLDLRWRTRQNVSADLDARWVVNSTLVSITSDLDLRWRTRQFVNSDVDLRWRTLEVVSNGLDVQWRVYGTVASTADLRWRVYGVVTGTLDVRWAVYVGMSADLWVLWRVRELVSADLSVLWVANAADLPTTPLPADVIAILDGTLIVADVGGDLRADVGGTIIVAYLSDYSRNAEL